MELAPIVLFVYNRPDHTRRALRAIAAADLAGQSTLYVYADGARSFAAEEELQQVAEVRELVRSHSWCGQVHLIESDWNRGFADSIVRGVTEVVSRHGRVIVLEDDIVVSPGFLRYMNDALDLYEDDPKVMHISGMIFGTPSMSGSSTAFLRILSCHGWATWGRAWQHYTPAADVLLKRLREQGITRRKFDIEGHATFYRQLVKNSDGSLNSWAVKWYASWLTAGGYSLFPRRSLSTNIGHDGSGVHAHPSFYNGETVEQVPVERIPVVEDSTLREEVDRIWRDGLRGSRKGALQQQSLRQTVSGLLGPIRRMGRRMLRFFYPELTMLDWDSPYSAVSPNSTCDSIISGRARIYPPYRIIGCHVGAYTYITRNSWISHTRIGKFCSIGPNVICGWGTHPTNGVSTSPMFYSTRKQNRFSMCLFNKVPERKPIAIGNDVFIGMNVTILDGVTIGDGAVIGAGCLVAKDVPPYAIVVGNPMRVLRYRFEPDVISRLQKIAWWDWPKEKLRIVEKHFFDIEAFLADCESGKQE